MSESSCEKNKELDQYSWYSRESTDCIVRVNQYSTGPLEVQYWLVPAKNSESGGNKEYWRERERTVEERIGRKGRKRSTCVRSSLFSLPLLFLYSLLSSLHGRISTWVYLGIKSKYPGGRQGRALRSPSTGRGRQACARKLAACTHHTYIPQYTSGYHLVFGVSWDLCRYIGVSRPAHIDSSTDSHCVNTPCVRNLVDPGAGSHHCELTHPTRCGTLSSCRCSNHLSIPARRTSDTDFGPGSSNPSIPPAGLTHPSTLGRQLLGPALDRRLLRRDVKFIIGSGAGPTNPQPPGVQASPPSAAAESRWWRGLLLFQARDLVDDCRLVGQA